MGFREQIQRAVSLSNVSTFGIGGPAELFFRATTEESLLESLEFVANEKCPFFLVGRGSNCLFSDDGFSGLVIQNRIESLQDLKDGKFVVSSGYSFPALGLKTAKDGWGGLEFAAGIPGTVGGAVFMNAGAHKQQIQDTVEWVEYVDERGTIVRLHREDLELGYRHSIFQHNKGVITSVCFQLQRDEAAYIRQQEMVEQRKKTQPYKDRSAGCVFRNPPGASAGRIIEEVGLKGMRIGGAEVSSLHANFIVNVQKATAKDVLHLMNHIKEVVAEKKGVRLESEIRIIPSTFT